MDANIAIGLATLVLAVAMGCFLAVALLAAGEGIEARSGKAPYRLRTDRALARPGTGPTAASLPAHCYYECMSDFHWSADWGNSCGEACRTST